MQNVLFISPTPTHPTHAGNRVHIKALSTFFRQSGYKVDFLYMAYEDYDPAAMEVFFEGRLHIVGREILLNTRKTGRYLMTRVNSRVQRIKRKMQFGLDRINKEQLQYNSEVDSWLSNIVKEQVTALQQKNKYHVVVCEYVFISKTLDWFGPDVFKILDTHDVFTNRYEKYTRNNVAPEWVSLYQEEEAKALKRADLVLAVSSSDANWFKSLAQTKVTLFNAVPQVNVLPPRRFKETLLYIGSGNEMNVAAIQFFARDIFPLLLEAFPAAKLIVAGTVCLQLHGLHPQIELVGPVVDIAAFYSSGDIVINPELDGTGYKVKAMEALAWGMPLLATTAGAKGVSEPDTGQLLIADSPASFAATLVDLFRDPGKLQQLSTQARQWVSQYRKTMEINLAACLPNEQVSKKDELQD